MGLSFPIILGDSASYTSLGPWPEGAAEPWHWEGYLTARLWLWMGAVA